ncbi:MAG: ATP-dependent DNA ligase [Kineosporiaceae bacterium]|nr:ATP-dependent DNA ligase [Kineosporiaceae bacterium]
MLLADVAATSTAVAGASGRRVKVDLLAERLRAASLGDLPILVSWLAGQPRQRRTGVGWAGLRVLPPAAERAILTVETVDAVLDQTAAAAGPGSATLRRELILTLLAQATAVEQLFLRDLLSGGVRQGAQQGLVIDAVAHAAGVPLDQVRRAMTFSGDLAAVATALRATGPAALADFGLQVGRPLAPMLAQSAPDVAAALERTGPAGLEWKLDGVRVQVHRDGDDIAVFTRTLDEVTDRLPEVVEAVRALPGRRMVLDGEVIALGPDARPLPFQVTAARTARRDVPTARTAVPLSTRLFDVLHLDDTDLLDRPGSERHEALVSVAPPELVVPRLVPDGETPAQRLTQAESFATSALAAGHEGVVVKSLEATYAMGRRGAAWVKVKPRITLDLVILAVERGHGRRSGWLSNLHLGARDPQGTYGPPGGFVMLGKTFKGLTDAMLRWQTERLTDLAIADDGYVVTVRPELVVEVAFDGVQTSSRYPTGMALRFARVLAHRPDKPAAQADTVEAVRAHHPG